MAWQEIPESVNDVLDFVPNRHNYRIKAEYGKLYYWVKNTGLNNTSKPLWLIVKEDNYEELE